MSNEYDHPNVIMPPPLIFACGIAGGLIFNKIAPWNMGHIYTGMVLFLLGLGLVAWAIATFKKHNTAIQPHLPATALVMTGPYRFSRNPIYLGFTLVYCGVALWIYNGWILVFLPAVLIVLHRGIILREEAYLTQKFGETYWEYHKRVRRWL